jgi:hypothetical protein
MAEKFLSNRKIAETCWLDIPNHFPIFIWMSMLSCQITVTKPTVKTTRANWEKDKYHTRETR